MDFQLEMLMKSPGSLDWRLVVLKSLLFTKISLILAIATSPWFQEKFWGAHEHYGSRADKNPSKSRQPPRAKGGPQIIVEDDGGS